MNKKKVKLVIGFITYGNLTARYLPFFLPSLKEQTFSDCELIAIDNSEEKNNANQKFLQESYPEINFFSMGKNLGFSRANNKIIEIAKEFNPEYIMFLNPDTILEKDAVEKMVDKMEQDTKVASISAKIKVWDFANNKKTEVIDSCGIAMRPGLRFVDLGQGHKDKGKYREADIIGPSGTAPMYRLTALEKIKTNGQYFEERMFMYKEDCDLAYRLFLEGFKTSLVAAAVIYHHRTARSEGEDGISAIRARKNKSKQVKKWSFKNQHLLFIKFWPYQSFRNKIAILVYALKMLVYALVFERYLLKEYPSL